MSIKRILILFLSIAILLSVSLFALVSTRQVNQYFSHYIDESYQKNIADIEGYAIDGLKTGYLHKATLSSYIEDPIYYIAVYDTEGELIADSSMIGADVMGGGMMNGKMGGMMNENSMASAFEFDASHMTVEEFELIENGTIVGVLAVTREISTVNTETSRLFRSSLLSSSIISLGITLVFAGFALFFVIRRINSGVMDVVDYAKSDERGRPLYQIAELNSIASSIETYRKQLSQKERIRKQKMDKVLHDTRTPLTILKSQLESVQDGLVSADQPMIQTLLNNVEALNTALTDITDVVEGQKKSPVIQLIRTDYTEELKKMIRSLEAKFHEKQLTLVLAADEFMIETNPAILNKAVYNLLMNSYKYTETGGVIVSADTDTQTLTIRDTGVGIRTDELDRIFEPYYRGMNAKQIEGEGLGLSIVKEQLSLIHAQISVTSVIGEYTEFIITF